MAIIKLKGENGTSRDLHFHNYSRELQGAAYLKYTVLNIFSSLYKPQSHQPGSYPHLWYEMQ